MNDALDAGSLADHSRALYALALRKVRNPALAEDLVQETFVTALGGAGARFAGRSSVRTWLIGILKHKVMDAFREHAKAPVSYDECVHGEAGDHPAGDEDGVDHATAHDVRGIDRGPEAAIAHKQFLQACQSQLDQLSPTSARAFVLSEVLGHETHEVCERLGITSSNLWTTLHRTRLALRGALESVRPA